MNDFSYSKKTDLIWLAGMAIGFCLTLVSAIFTPWPAYKTGQFWVYAMLLGRILLYWAAGEHKETKIFGALLSMGLVTGFVELLADYWLVNCISSGRLIYVPRNDVILLASPIWMPFAWAAVTVEFGYPVLRLANLLRKPGLAAVIGAVYAGTGVGSYEYLANACGWWYYAPAKKMIGDFCALYIPLGEALLFLCFYAVFTRTRVISRPGTRAIVSGSIFGLLILLCYAVAYYLLEVL